MNARISKLGILPLLIAFILSGCNTSDTVLDGIGTITGKVVSPNGTGIADAVVEVLNNSDYTTRTNLSGNFSLDAPAGTQQLRIYTGSGDIFSTSLSAEITLNSDRDIGSVMLNDEGTMGFVWGDYDNIQSIVRDTLGYPLDSITLSELLIASNWSQWDLIFLNCGDHAIDEFFEFDQADADLFRSNLTSYVLNGGSVYTSDWTIAFLTETCDDTSGYVEVDINNTLYTNTSICFELLGQVEAMTVNVDDADLSALIGSTAEIAYDLPDWAFIYPAAGFAGSTILSDPNTGAALAFSDQVGSGSVLYTTFHNEANITDDMLEILEWYIFNF